jgi:hypothetical protein
MKKIKIITNPYEGTEVIHDGWIIKNTDDFSEPQRVTVKFNGKEYSLVLDEDCPRLEIWEDDDGEPGRLPQMEKVFDLTEPYNTVMDKEYEESPPYLPGFESDDTNDNFDFDSYD